MATQYDTLEQKAAAGDIFAFGGSPVDANGQPVTKAPTSSPVLLSTTQGADNVRQDQQTLTQISGTPPSPLQALPGESADAYNKRLGNTAGGGAGTGYLLPKSDQTQPKQQGTLAEPAPGSGSVSYINPTTNQTQVFDASSLTPDQVDSLTSQGYHIMESKGTVAPWITSGDTATGRKETEAKKAEDEFNTLKGQLASYMVTDAQLQSQIGAITAQWDARINEMKNINERRAKALNTTGLRLGSQYTGGSGGVFGGIVSEEERQGVARIGELEARKQEAITAAREAARTKNWDVFAKQVGFAEDAYKKKQEELAALNKATIENNKKIKEASIQASRNSAIADLVSQGLTDVGTLLNTLNYDDKGKLIGDFTAEEISKSLKSILPAGMDDIAKTAAQNGAPADVIKSILASKNLNDAYAAAGSFLETGTGIVGEYNYYKRQSEANGQVPMSFNEYQDMDANRKKSIAAAANAATGGLTTKQTQNFLTISNKFQADPFINNALKGQTAVTIADQVLANPGSASNQLKSLYSLVKNLDPDSAVREGEVSLAEKTQSYFQNFKTSLDRITKGQVISSDAAVELANATKELAGAWFETAKRREKQYKAQAKVGGVGDAFNEYLSASGVTEDMGSSLIQDENEAKQSVIEYGKSNPDLQAQIKEKSTNNDPDLGRPLSWSEIKQLFQIP